MSKWPRDFMLKQFGLNPRDFDGMDKPAPPPPEKMVRVDNFELMSPQVAHGMMQMLGILHASRGPLRRRRRRPDDNLPPTDEAWWQAIERDARGR